MDITENFTLKTFPEVPDNWSLANDAILSKLLQRLSEKLTLKTHDVQTALDNLENSLSSVGVEVCNTNNDLFVLSHKQFMENRTYVGGQLPQRSDPSSSGKISMTMANETGIFTACKSALLYGITISKERDKDENAFTSRTLTPIIGSDDFLLQRNHCSPNQKTIAKSSSYQSLQSDQSSSALQSTATTPISVTPVPEKISNPAIDHQVPNLGASSFESNEHLHNEAAEEILPDSDADKRLPTEAKVNLNTTLPPIAAISPKKSNLFDSSSDSDGMFESKIRSNRSKSPLMAVESSNGSNKAEHLPIKKVPAGGISIFPPSEVNKPAITRPQQPTPTSSTSKPIVCGPNALNSRSTPVNSHSDTFAPVTQRRVRLPASSLAARKSLFSSSSDEDAADINKRSQPAQKPRVPIKRKQVQPSKQKSIWSSDDSDSDPFSCSVDATPSQMSTSRVIPVHSDAIKDTQKLGIPGDKLVRNRKLSSPELIASVIPNVCDIFSRSNDEVSHEEPDHSLHKSVYDGGAVKPLEENLTKEESHDEDIFNTHLHSSSTYPGTEANYSLNIVPDDTLVPALPDRSLNSDSDEYDDIFSPGRYSPPPMSHVVYPSLGSSSPPMFEQPNSPRRSNSLLGESPPPMYDTVAPFPVEIVAPKCPNSSLTYDSCERLPGAAQKIDKCEVSREINVSVSVKNVNASDHEKPNSTTKKCSPISPLESQQVFASCKETIEKSLTLGGSVTVTKATRQRKPDMEEAVCFSNSPPRNLLVSLQKERPRIQQKRRFPTKRAHKQWSNTQEAGALREPEARGSPASNQSSKSSKSNISSIDYNQSNNISTPSSDSSGSIFRSDSRQLTNDQIATNKSKNIVPPTPADLVIKELEKKQTVKVDSKNDKHSVEDIPSSTLSQSIAGTVNDFSGRKNVPKKTSLFGSDSSEEDWLFSSSSGKPAADNPNSVKKGGNNINNTLASSKDTNVPLFSEPLQESVAARQKATNINENKKPSQELGEAVIKSIPRSKYTEKPLSTQRGKSKMAKLFDSSDEDDIFSPSAGNHQIPVDSKGGNFLPGDRHKARKISVENNSPDKTITVGSHCNSGVVPLSNSIMDASSHEKDRQVKDNVDLNPSEGITATVGARLKTEPSPNKLFDDSSDEFDLFSPTSSKSKLTGQQPVESSRTTTITISEREKVSNISNSVSVGKDRDLRKPDILRTNYAKEISSSSTPVANAVHTSMSDNVTSCKTSVKREHKSKKISIFGSDSSSDDGIFSSKNLFSSSQNRKGNQPIAKTNALKQAPSKTQYLDGESLLVNSPSDGADYNCAPNIIRKSSTPSELQLAPEKIINEAPISTKLATGHHQKSPDFSKLFSDSDDDAMFNQKKQSAIAKTATPARFKNLFPSSDEDDDLFKPTKKS